MRRVRLFLGVLTLLAVGCRSTSHLEPEARVVDLNDGARARLCRFTVDHWEGVIPVCEGEPEPLGFEQCLETPPWWTCDGGPTVGAWEDCVIGLSGDPCAPDPPCERPLCR